MHQRSGATSIQTALSFHPSALAYTLCTRPDGVRITSRSRRPTRSSKTALHPKIDCGAPVGLAYSIHESSGLHVPVVAGTPLNKIGVRHAGQT